jgi:RND family efflux transporter MFP subunit
MIQRRSSDGRPGDARAALILLGALGLPWAGCGFGGGAAEKEAEAAPAQRVVVVTVVPAEKATLQRAIDVVGSLKGWEEVTVGSKETGRVLGVLHDIGDRVEPGEELVKLDPADARIAIQQAESQLLGELVKLGITRNEAEKFVGRYGYSEEIIVSDEVSSRIDALPAVKQAELSLEKARLDLNRFRQLAQKNAATMQDLQNAENAEAIAQATLDNAKQTARTVIANALATRVALSQAEQRLADMTIRVPKPTAPPAGFESMDGLTYAVTKRQASEGQMMRPGDPVVDLVLEDPLKLWANVPERYSAEVKIGQPIEISVASYPGEIFKGTVARINPSVDPVNRTFQVEGLFRNGDRRLLPGSFAKARILTREDADVTVVPINSVVRTSGVVKLFVFEPAPEAGKDRGIAHEVRVQTGREQDGVAEILDGLPEGALVVTSGQTQLADLWPVVLRQEEAEAAEGGEATAEGEVPQAGPAKEETTSPAKSE